jgi:ATP-binding cassette subfamily C protein CydC
MVFGLGLSLLTGVGAAGAGVGLMATSAWLISRAATQPPVLHLMVAIVAVRAFGIGRGVLRYAERLTGHDAALRLLSAVRVACYRRIERLAPAGLAGFRRGDVVQRLVGDIDGVVDLTVRVALPLTVSLFVAAGSVALVGTALPVAGWALAGALLVVGAGAPAVHVAVGRRAAARVAPLRGRLAADAVDLAWGLPELVAYGGTGPVLDRLAGTDRRLRATAERTAATTGLAGALTVLATGACLIVGLAAGAVAVRAGTMPGEMLAVIVLTPLATFEAMGSVPAAVERLPAALGALRRIRAVLHAADPTPDPPAAEPLPLGPYTVRLDSVTAGWTAERPVLRDVSLTLPPGRRVALVGPSGAGKTTVAALLVRWLDPAAGRVTLNDVDLRRLRGSDVRTVIGYAGDDAYLFDSTIAANLRIGRPGATDAELRDALAAARLAGWVDTLPAGLQTPVGAHGRTLSGGQRRRLALARALLADFPILVLDEPTEHLDEPTAAAVTRDLLEATRGRTVLLITHRLVDLDQVDQIVRLGPAQPESTARTSSAMACSSSVGTTQTATPAPSGEMTGAPAALRAGST